MLLSLSPPPPSANTLRWSISVAYRRISTNERDVRGRGAPTRTDDEGAAQEAGAVRCADPATGISRRPRTCAAERVPRCRICSDEGAARARRMLVGGAFGAA